MDSEPIYNPKDYYGPLTVDRVTFDFNSETKSGRGRDFLGFKQLRGYHLVAIISPTTQRVMFAFIPTSSSLCGTDASKMRTGNFEGEKDQAMEKFAGFLEIPTPEWPEGKLVAIHIHLCHDPKFWRHDHEDREIASAFMERGLNVKKIGHDHRFSLFDSKSPHRNTAYIEKDMYYLKLFVDGKEGFVEEWALDGSDRK